MTPQFMNRCCSFILLALLCPRGSRAFQTHKFPTRRLPSGIRSTVSSEQEAAILDWSKTAAAGIPPASQLLITDIQDDIPLAAMFWNVMADLPASTTAVFAFPLAEFSLESFAEMIHGLEFLDLNVTVCHNGPCPTMMCQQSASATPIATSQEVSADPMRQWVQDVIVDSRVCPYTKSADVAGVGVPGVTPATIGYPMCKVVGSDRSSTCAVLASFWNNCIDLLNTAPQDLSTILLCAPHVAVQSHANFARISNAIVASLQQAKANRYVSLVFFHPLYDRSEITPSDRLIHGHLPPQEWLRSYLRNYHTEKDVNSLTESELSNANYQRRAPYFCINVLRAEQVAQAENVVPWDTIEPTPGRTLRVSGGRIYAQNTWRLATQSVTKSHGEYVYRVVSSNE